MLRPALALTLLALFGGAAFGLRTLTHIRRYGDSGWRFSRPDGPAVVSHVLLATGIVLLVAAPVAALAAGAAHRPLGWADLGRGDGAPGVAGAVVGAALATAGAVVTLVAQRNMGASWRIGVAPEERTSLITGGLFRHIRNPIFSGMGMFAAGEALLVPNSLSLLAPVLSACSTRSARWRSRTSSPPTAAATAPGPRSVDAFSRGSGGASGEEPGRGHVPPASAGRHQAARADSTDSHQRSATSTTVAGADSWPASSSMSG